ncbi:hypothetical protein BASA62_004588 [Batrachochytrium salamandrivorans]|nr:hypothetical protein BASA62_004588 [Batrachochytrium salamandrivorans]
MKTTESKPYSLVQETDGYRQFVEEEDKHFKLEYRSVEKLSEKFSPPPECHGTEVSALYGKHAGAKCISPRPQNRILPFEIEMQAYLLQDVYESLHVPRVTDYVVTENTYVLVMKYPGEEWMALDEYLEKYGKLFVDEACLVTKEVVTALVSLKTRSVLYNKETDGVKLMNFGFSGLLEEWNQDSSASGSSEDESHSWGTEKGDTRDIGELMYHLLTSKDPFKNQIIQKEVAKKLGDSLENPKFQLSIDTVDLVTTLFDKKSSKMTFLEDILGHSFFTHQ